MAVMVSESSTLQPNDISDRVQLLLKLACLPPPPPHKPRGKRKWDSLERTNSHILFRSRTAFLYKENTIDILERVGLSRTRFTYDVEGRLYGTRVQSILYICIAAVDGVDMQLDRICNQRVGVLYQKLSVDEVHMQLWSTQLDNINCTRTSPSA